VPLEAGFEEVQALARQMIDEALREGAEAVLVGGLSSLAIALYEEAARHGLTVVEALTERILDERGRFVFRHRGFRTLWTP